MPSRFFASVLVERADLLSQATRRIGRFLVLDPRYLAPILAAWGLSLLILLAENDLAFVIADQRCAALPFDRVKGMHLPVGEPAWKFQPG